MPVRSTTRCPALVLALGLVILLLSACAHRTGNDQTSADHLASSPWAQSSQTSATSSSGWKHQEFPGKRANVHRYAYVDGRHAVLVSAASSISMLRYSVRLEPAAMRQVRFSWKVPALIEAADLSDRDRSDSPVRVVLAFEGDRSKFSARDAMLSELAHALTGEPMPYATLMYVWDTRAAPGSVIIDKRTSRIRKMVMESGPDRLNQWLDYERDVRADFEKAFGEAPGTLVSIGIMTDTDNTDSGTKVWYGPVQLVRGP